MEVKKGRRGADELREGQEERLKGAKAHPQPETPAFSHHIWIQQLTWIKEEKVVKLGRVFKLTHTVSKSFPFREKYN